MFLCRYSSIKQSSELCINTIIKVFRQDLTGAPSLEIVRMLNRMIKERRFAIHPNVLSCLLHLRLRTELGVRASDTKVEKETQGTQDHRRRKGNKTDQPYLSKKSKKALKEKKEIEKEMRAAEAEIDKEERATTVSHHVLFSPFGLSDVAGVRFVSLPLFQF
jgi:nucleolar complex protein 3